MKTNLYIYVVLLVSVFTTSCMDKIKDTYKVNEPIYMSYEDLRQAVNTKSAQDLVQPGKLYFKDDAIFVNEYMKGIHVINNSDPSNPVKLKFIEIPGNVDIAIKGSILYADSYVDLVAIDISDLSNIQEVARVENAFPYIIPDVEEGIIEYIDKEKGVVTGYRHVSKSFDAGQHVYYQRFPDWRSDGFFASAEMTGGAGKDFGTGGSMARFTLYSDYLYAIHENTLKLFNISNSVSPSDAGEFYIGWNMETLFPYQQKLFIGTTTGMLIYSLENPAEPQFISEFAHVTSCDPVVVEGNHAYVTLRAGNLCGDNTSQLNVIDISSITNPHLIKEYVMTEPYGLGIDNSVLFVCDGDAGLKIYDATDPLLISDNMVAHYPDINAFDVIPLGEILLMIGRDGLYQFEYSDISNIQQLSFIPITSK